MKENLTVVAFYAAILAGLFIVGAVLYEFMKNHTLGKYRIFALILGFLFIGSPFIGRITLRLPGDTEVIVEKMDKQLESMTLFLSEFEADYAGLRSEINDLNKEMAPMISQAKSGSMTRENILRYFTGISEKLEYICNQSDSLSIMLKKAREENSELRKNMNSVISKIN